MTNATGIRPFLLIPPGAVMRAALLACGALLLPASTHASDPLTADPSRRHGNHIRAHANWCGVHLLRREYRLAIEDCDEALADNPTDSGSYSNRGIAYLQLGQNDNAIADFQAAQRLDPSDPVVLYNLAGAYVNIGAYRSAISCYTEVIRLQPGHAFAYNNRGRAYELAGDRNYAIADYRRAMAFSPELSHVIQRNLERLQTP